MDGAVAEQHTDLRARLRDVGRNAVHGRVELSPLQYTIAAGTSQIQRNLIAERILGLPTSRPWRPARSTSRPSRS